MNGVIESHRNQRQTGFHGNLSRLANASSRERSSLLLLWQPHKHQL